MNHLKWRGHASTIYDIQKSLYKEKQDCDVTLVAKGTSVRAHRFILSTCSDLLCAALSDVPFGQDTTIVIPDVKGSLLESLISFVYLGKTTLASSSLEEFMETINVLGINAAVSFEFTSSAGETSGNTIGEKPLEQDVQMVEQEPIDNVNIENENAINNQQAKKDLKLFNEAPIKSNPPNDHVYSKESIIKTGKKKNDGETMMETTSAKRKRIKYLSNKNVANNLEETLKPPKSPDEIVHPAENAMELAVKNVIYEGLSLSLAARKHNVSNAELYRRVRKHPNLGRERIMAGESIASISLQLEIPASTLRSQKARLIDEGRLPDHCVLEKQQSEEELKIRLAKAMRACVHDGMSQTQAAKFFDIPKNRLWRHIQDRIADAKRLLSEDAKEPIK